MQGERERGVNRHTNTHARTGVLAHMWRMHTHRSGSSSSAGSREHVDDWSTTSEFLNRILKVKDGKGSPESGAEM